MWDEETCPVCNENIPFHISAYMDGKDICYDVDEGGTCKKCGHELELSVTTNITVVDSGR